ncbi:MAG: asparagine synthase C-terminal domain-containing protein [Thermoplasmatales archaeon]
MEWKERLKEALLKSVSKLPQNGLLLFSGGLDSSLIAFIASNQGKEISLFSVGTRSSHDYYWSREAASILNIPLEFVELDERSVLEGLREVKSVTGETELLTLLIELPLYLCCKISKSSFIISGQGADELFMGYKKYEQVDTANQDLEIVFSRITAIEGIISGTLGKKVLYPYLDNDLVAIARSIPKELKIYNGERKYILRQVAQDLGLDDRIVWKPKKAMQYSTGIKKLVDTISRRNGKAGYQLISSL